MKQYVTVQKSTGQQGYYSGNNPASLSFVPGILPGARQWPNYGNYIDTTDNVSDPQKMELTWTLNRDSFGAEVPDGGQATKKSASGSLTFEGESFQLLKKWLIDDVSASLNVVQVMIEDVGCGRYTDYQISAKDIIYCENAVCTFDITLKQIEEPLTCIQRTIISDNWQGWFQPIPANGKKHPRFSYCNERRPNGLMIVEWVLLSLLGTIMLLLIPLFAVIALVVIVINAIIAVINAIISFINALGADINEINPIASFNPLAPLDGVANMYIESSGCGREHPAPLVRDYIANVCFKCGVTVDATTAPIFFSNIITWDTNSRGPLQNANNPHHNACYLYVNNRRGIRRFKNLSFSGNSIPATDFYIPETRPLDTLDMFLDRLKGLYNFEWELKSINNSGQLQPTLFIKRKDYYKQPTGNGYLFDFSETGVDRGKLVHGICYEWNGQKQPAFIKGLYSDDAADTCGNEAREYFDDNIEIGNIDINPNLDGHLDKSQQFGRTRFRLDGVSGDYLYDAFQLVANVSFFTLFLSSIVLAMVRDYLLDYADYALLLKDETCTLPKILLWDGQSFENAKCIRPYFATANNGNTPQINQKYNDDNHTWQQRHPADTYVKGYTGALQNPLSQPFGAYQVKDVFGIITIVRPAMLVNYYMSFAQDFQDSMWDYFHWIDDPRNTSILNQNFTLRIPLCCDDLRRLNVFNNAGQIELGGKVKLPNQYNPDGKITEIKVSYDTSGTEGQYIELKGQL